MFFWFLMDGKMDGQWWHGAAIYGAPWIPSIYPSHVSIYTSTMDPMAMMMGHLCKSSSKNWWQLSNKWGRIGKSLGMGQRTHDEQYWLVVSTYLHLWKMMEWSSVGMMTFPIWWESHKISWFHDWLLYPMEYPIKNTTEYPKKKYGKSIQIQKTLPVTTNQSLITINQHH